MKPLLRPSFQRASPAEYGVSSAERRRHGPGRDDDLQRTVSYRSTPGGNFASLSNYLQADYLGVCGESTRAICHQLRSRHRERAHSDVDEIIEAQTFAGRLVEEKHASKIACGWSPLNKSTATPKRWWKGRGSSLAVS